MFRVLAALCCCTMLARQISAFSPRSNLLSPISQALRLTRRFASVDSTAVSANPSGSPSDVVASRLKVKKIFESNDLLGTVVTVQGWVRTVRDQKKFSFIEINDGSTLIGIQAVALAEIESYGELERFTTGAAVEVVGTVVASIGKGNHLLFSSSSFPSPNSFIFKHDIIFADIQSVRSIASTCENEIVSANRYFYFCCSLQCEQ